MRQQAAIWLIVAAVLLAVSQLAFVSSGSAPFQSSGFAVMILRESTPETALPPDQAAIFTNADLLKYCESHCVELPDGSSFFRVLDDDHADFEFADPAIKAAFQAVKEQAVSLPWIAISTGRGGVSRRLPGNVDDAMGLLEKYGGE